MSRRCWTCNTEHDLDMPCKQSPMATARRAAAGSDDLFDDASEPVRLGPVFMATYEGECTSCDEVIQPGEDIRADGAGGWIHADDMCEKVARS